MSDALHNGTARKTWVCTARDGLLGGTASPKNLGPRNGDSTRTYMVDGDAAKASRRNLLAITGLAGALSVGLVEILSDLGPAYAAGMWNHPFASRLGSISTEYGPDGGRFHRGTDYSWSGIGGEPIYSVARGVVTFAG
ncbi:MAG: hypothetical protein ACRCYU_09440, partial [Nocardioides sp.]